MNPLPFEIAAQPEAIRATLYPASAAGRRHVLLVLAHGAGAGQQSPFIVHYATGLAGRGLDVVTFDFAYLSRGRKTPDRAPVLEATFRAAVAGANARDELRGSRIAIGGKSMGGRIATHLAAAPEAWPADVAAADRRRRARLSARAAARQADRRSGLSSPEAERADADRAGDARSVRRAGRGARRDLRRAATPPIDIITVEGGDHSFAVLKSSGRDPVSGPRRRPGSDRHLDCRADRYRFVQLDGRRFPLLRRRAG